MPRNWLKGMTRNSNYTEWETFIVSILGYTVKQTIVFWSEVMQSLLDGSFSSGYLH